MLKLCRWINFSLFTLITAILPNLVSAEPIKIGIAGPFSGPYVAAGDQQWQGAMQAIEDINKSGGIRGNNLVLISADDACTPKKAEQIAKKFVASHEITAVVGHNCSSTTVAAAKIYADAKLLMITPASTTPEITEHNYLSIFRTCGRDDAQGQVAANFMSNKLKAKRIAIFYDSSVYGKGIAENTKNALEKLGNPPILYQALAHNQSKYADLIKQISAIEPDVIYFGGLHTDAGNFLKYLHEHGNHTIFMGSDGIASPDFVRAAGGPNNVANVYMTFFDDPTAISEAKKVVKALEDKHVTTTGYTLNSYAAVQAIATALKNAPPDRTSEWLHQNTVDSVIGPLKWDQKGDLKKELFIVYKWNENGGYDPYWTAL
jgi:branched-chain amino acid transport system substrate-binding protein